MANQSLNYFLNTDYNRFVRVRNDVVHKLSNKLEGKCLCGEKGNDIHYHFCKKFNQVVETMTLKILNHED